jgi:hypothetical protein
LPKEFATKSKEIVANKPKVVIKITKSLAASCLRQIEWMIIPSINAIPKIETMRYTVIKLMAERTF